MFFTGSLNQKAGDFEKFFSCVNYALSLPSGHLGNKSTACRGQTHR